MNTKLRTEAKLDFEKHLFQLIDNAVWKNYGNVIRHKELI